MSSRVSVVVRCAIRVIESDRASGELVVAAARAIIADTEFNARFHSLKSSSSGDQMLERLEQYEKVSESCESALTKFEAEPQGGGEVLLAAFAEVRRLAGDESR